MALALAALLMLVIGGGAESAAGQAFITSSTSAATNGRIAFVLGTSPGKCQGAVGDLATANPDGSQCQVFTTSGGAGFPALNPAGDTIAFTLGKPPASAVYLIGVDGTGERQLIPGPSLEPTWSPDGTEIAFTGQQSGTSQIYVADAQTGSILAQLTTGPGDSSEPAWSPNGAEIAFVSDRGGSNRLFVMRADGTNQHPLTRDRGTDAYPTWSPNSQSIAFANDDLAAGKFQIYQIKANGTAETRVTKDGLNDQSPSWSPDGRLIAFTSYSTKAADTIGLAHAPGASPPGALPRFSGEEPDWAPLPPPSTPVPGHTINATPNGQVQVQPGGSSLAEPLNGPVSVPVTPAAPTIFRPAPGASVTLSTLLTGGRSSVITISQGAVSVSQPGGGSIRIALMGHVSNPCRPAMARAAYVPGGLVRWRITDRGNGPPRAVKGKVTVYFQGTAALIEDICQPSPGMQQLNVIRQSGNVIVKGIGTQPIKPNGSPCAGNAGDHSSMRLASHRLSTTTLQLLHASAHGKFCTTGRYSAATVRG